MKVRLNDVRIAFPRLYQPKAIGQGDKKYYSAVFIIDPKSKNHAELEAAIKAVAADKWADKARGIVAKLRQEGRVGYKHAPLTNAEGAIYDGFEGMYSLNASRAENKGRPGVFDKYKDPATGVARVLTEADGKPYAGCYVTGVVNVWAQDNTNGRRVNFELEAVQFREDGDAFAGGGSRVTAEQFEAIEEGADAADLA